MPAPVIGRRAVAPHPILISIPRRYARLAAEESARSAGGVGRVAPAGFPRAYPRRMMASRARGVDRAREHRACHGLGTHRKMSETPATPSSSPNVIEVTSETFEREIIGRSSTVPVVVDFWAPWCGPCRMLSPVLEKLADEYDGKFVLAKVDIDRSPDVAGQFGVRSIPAVFGVRDGQAIDAFVGVQPEAAVRGWIDRLLPTEAESLAALGRGLEDSIPVPPKPGTARRWRSQPDLPRPRSAWPASPWPRGGSRTPRRRSPRWNVAASSSPRPSG